MITSDLFIQVNGAYRGTDDDAPTSGSTDHELWLATANRKIAEYARDGKQSREALFEVRNVGTVVAADQVYDLAEIVLPADSVIVTTVAGNDIEFTIVKPQERDRFSNAVYISGMNPQTLTFYDEIDADSEIVGGTIKVAGYWLPDDLDDDADVVPVDDPYWLVYAVAAELAFNDLTYENKYPDLVAKANNLYRQMNSNNRRGTSGNPRTVQTNVTRITGTSINRTS
jgi:hypothetical protein